MDSNEIAARRNERLRLIQAAMGQLPQEEDLEGARVTEFLLDLNEYDWLRILGKDRTLIHCGKGQLPQDLDTQGRGY